MKIEINTMAPVQFACVRNGVGFNPLPVSERESDSSGNRCCCPYCSDSPGRSTSSPLGAVWDSSATDLATGRTWKVHYPELHGLPRKRAEW
jgi:hypothetical protein